MVVISRRCSFFTLSYLPAGRQVTERKERTAPGYHNHVYLVDNIPYA